MGSFLSFVVLVVMAVVVALGFLAYALFHMSGSSVPRGTAASSTRSPGSKNKAVRATPEPRKDVRNRKKQKKGEASSSSASKTLAADKATEPLLPNKEDAIKLSQDEGISAAPPPSSTPFAENAEINVAPEETHDEPVATQPEAALLDDSAHASEPGSPRRIPTEPQEEGDEEPIDASASVEDEEDEEANISEETPLEAVNKEATEERYSGEELKAATEFVASPSDIARVEHKIYTQPQNAGHCQICKATLSLYTLPPRRHHCRVCYNTVCSQCSPHTDVNLNNGQVFQRVCDRCWVDIATKLRNQQLQHHEAERIEEQEQDEPDASQSISGAEEAAKSSSDEGFTVITNVADEDQEHEEEDKKE
ncbi:hypothetical protein QOT17_001631 [Balamuthia mandrillaris]